MTISWGSELIGQLLGVKSENQRMEFFEGSSKQLPHSVNPFLMVSTRFTLVPYHPMKLHTKFRSATQDHSAKDSNLFDSDFSHEDAKCESMA